jgi:hypothetical protein
MSSKFLETGGRAKSADHQRKRGGVVTDHLVDTEVIGGNL